MKEIDFDQIAAQTIAAVKEAVKHSELESGDIFLIGGSTSEVCGGHIGKNQMPTSVRLLLNRLFQF
ncbi:DUF436 family protein [Treponema phagedenis]|nr:DUF436 family protein [Treponema phagedenis]NVP24995.1 DUF436 family protein [Treponema phagedenis]QEK08327.1 DUF436 family protein [Treponema phagedenis]QLC59300.1 DUF436 family protein [Treponema phagedenis]QSH98703.1 DUF436 family protein [Treponema phagedenis]